MLHKNSKLALIFLPLALSLGGCASKSKKDREIASLSEASEHEAPKWQVALTELKALKTKVMQKRKDASAQELLWEVRAELHKAQQNMRMSLQVPSTAVDEFNRLVHEHCGNSLWVSQEETERVCSEASEKLLKL